jgi:hypothetical protein
VPCQYDFRRRVIRDGGKRKEPYNSTLIFFMTWFIVYLEKGLHPQAFQRALGQIAEIVEEVNIDRMAY